MEIAEDIEKMKKKGKKGFIIGLILLVVFAGITIFSFVCYNQINDNVNGWFRLYEVDPNDPEKLIAISMSPLLKFIYSIVPKLINTAQVLFVTLLVLYIVGWIIKAVFKGTPRKITIGKLVGSITKVVIWVVSVIAILAVWGMNVGALIASAGVLTLVVGLGMQNLIADVVAGIFLVCDGTLQVGDIVTIDGWRGTVQEIGIRNTKLINYSGDIRVANNSTIKIYVNQSREDSYPTVLVGIPYEADLEKVKEVFEANKAKIRAMCPVLISDIDFNGVEELADSSVNLHFGAKCKEADFFAAQREMRGAIKMVFEENGISVPFPQVDVHMDQKN